MKTYAQSRYPKCDSCEACMINGHYCHETGCPNSRAIFMDGRWVKFAECRECGDMIERGETCDCCEQGMDDDCE